MISEKCVKRYCKDNINLIENYIKAISDNTQQYDCHHKLEITLNCGTKKLKEKNLYFNRPSNELIFLTHSEHVALHNKQRKGSKRTSEQKQNMRESHIGNQHLEETKKKISDVFKNRIWINNKIKNKRIYLEQLSYYLNIGYKLGRLPFNKPKLKGHPCYTKGKHRVWDNKELNKYHYE